MYGTVVDVGVVAEACKEVAPDPVAFNTQWRAKQLEYTFLRSLMGRYRDFGKVTEEALEFAIQRFALQVTAEQRQRLSDRDAPDRRFSADERAVANGRNIETYAEGAASIAGIGDGLQAGGKRRLKFLHTFLEQLDG